MYLALQYFSLATFCAVFLLFVFFKKNFQFFEKRGIVFLKPEMFFGNIAPTIKRKENIAVTLRNLYKKIRENGWKYGGIFIFTSPSILVTDLDIIKNVLVTDFECFTDRPCYLNEKNDPLSVNVSQMEGARWKMTRAKITPIFSSSSIKKVFQSITDSQEVLHKRIEALKEKPINMRQIVTYYINDSIASCAFGLDLSKLQNNDIEKYRFYAEQSGLIDGLKLLFCVNFKKIGQFFGLTFFDKNIGTYFFTLIKDTVAHREKNNIRRNDILQKLIDLKNDTSDNSITLTEMASHAFIVLVSAFGSNSTIISLALYELSKNEKLQDKVREEIKNVLKNYKGNITYDSLQEMKYLTQVVKETLRLYTPASFTIRLCTKDYKVPNDSLTFKKGDHLCIPIWGIHTDEQYYPNPEKFDPDRFNDENLTSQHKFSYMPFGQGPRYCFGQRFAMLQTQFGIATIINKYKIAVNEKTVEPLQYDKNSVVQVLKEDIWLNVKDV